MVPPLICEHLAEQSPTAAREPLLGNRHNHSHDGHAHGVSAHTDLRWLTVALTLNALFMLIEVAAGAIASSLALRSDAAHLLTDAGAIGLALVAARLTRRRPAAL